MMQVALYLLEKEGGQHEDADRVLPVPFADNSGDRTLIAIFEMTTFLECKIVIE